MNKRRGGQKGRRQKERGKQREDWSRRVETEQVQGHRNLRGASEHARWGMSGEGKRRDADGARLERDGAPCRGRGQQSILFHPVRRTAAMALASRHPPAPTLLS